MYRVLQVEKIAKDDNPSVSQASMDNSEEAQNEDEEGPGDRYPYEGDEDEIKSCQKLNSVSTISRLRVQPLSSSRFNIPLCRMLAMPTVRPTLSSDLAKLEQEFVHGYREGASVFYVTLTDEEDNTHWVTEAHKASWSPIWNAKMTNSIPFLSPFRS